MPRRVRSQDERGFPTAAYEKKARVTTVWVSTPAAAQTATPGQSPIIDDDDRNFIWVYDLSGDTTVRQLEFDGRNDLALWTSDGEWITFGSTRDSEQPDTTTTFSIYRRRADGTGVVERLTTAEEGHRHYPESYSGDGRLSFSHAVGGATSVWTLSSEDGVEPELFVDVPESNQLGSVFSPDGNWIAYHSNESGALEIYVQPFPPTGQKSQITQTGGRFPLWSPEGWCCYEVAVFRQKASLGHAEPR